MPDSTAVLSSIAIGLVLVIMLAFALGTQRNVRTGNERLRWLQPALPQLGARTTLRWLGSSVVQLDLVEPREPFREVTVMVVLEPRDVPLLWLFARAGGRRDVLIFRTSLRRAPRLELEAAAGANWLKPGDADEVRGWAAVPFPGGVEAKADARGNADLVAAASRAWERLTAASGGAWRLSIRTTVPHLEVHVRPPADPRSDPDRLVRAIRELAVELSRA